MTKKDGTLGGLIIIAARNPVRDAIIYSFANIWNPA